MVFQDFFNKTECAQLICKNDRYSTVVEANSAFYSLVGYSKLEFSSKFNNRFSSLLLDDLDEILKKVKKATDRTHVLDYEYRIRHKNGQTLWIHDIATYIPDLDVFYVVIMDISYKTIALEQEKRRQFAEATTKANETFLSHISHDIRSPLNGILGMAQLAKDTQDKAKLENYLDQLLVSGNHLKLLVDSLLRIFEIDSELTKVNLAQMSLCSLFEEIISIIKPLAQDKSQLLTFKSNLINDEVISDEFLIREIVMNLVSNAIKYTNDFGKIMVEINQGENIGPSVYEYEIKVIDNGIGISEEAMENILEPFYRSPDTLEDETEGNGVGLNIVKSYTNYLKGSINIQSEQGIGTTFSIKVPMKTSSIVLPPQEKTKELTAPNVEKKVLNILVVEDNEINAEIIKTILTEFFCEVTVAQNGREAVDIFKESSVYYFDCVFMDINMPVLDGYEATILIRNSFREDQNVPIYALSAHVFPKEISTANQIGMNGYLTKPIDMAALHKVINSLY